jgi:hypothetical protein
MPAKKIWFLFLLILPLLAAACADNGQRELSAEELARLPTLAPSITPSEVPSLTPTWTPTATRTFTPEPTDTPIPSPTPRTPTATPTATRTPTATLEDVTAAPSITLTFTPPATLASNQAPVITSFTASTTSAQPNAVVTLIWQGQGASAIIEQLDAQNNAVQTFPVAVSGQQQVTLPAAGPQVVYQLVISNTSGQEAVRQVIIQISGTGSVPGAGVGTCATPWFFTNPPADAGCPAAAATTVTGRSEPFGNSIMIAIPYNNQNMIFGFNSRDMQYAAFQIQWDGVQTYSDPSCGTPSFGQQEPVAEFNWAFYNTLAPFGRWCDPNTGIGWATGPASQTSFRIQNSQQSQAFYIDIPNFGILRLSGTLPTGTWSRVQ